MKKKSIREPNTDKSKERLLKFINSPGKSVEQLQSVFPQAIELGVDDVLESKLQTMKIELDESE